MRQIQCVLVLAFIAPAVSQDLFLVAKPLAAKHQASAADLARAKTRTHSGYVAGKSTAEISDKINKHLERQALKLQECSSFSHDDLNNIVRKMHDRFSPELQEAYNSGGKDLRLRRENSLDDYEKRWMKEDADFKKSADSSEALREAKCAEVLMLWVHHLPEAAKKAMKDIALPKLPEFKLETIRQTPSVAGRYADSYTCVTGHNMQSGHTSDHKYPHWPEEVHYYGKGHGAYPFWMGGKSPSGDSSLEVWWSEKQLAEKFYHHACAISEAGASEDAPCYHLFVGGQPNPAAYLYTAKEDFCCVSSPSRRLASNQRRLQSGNTEKLAAPSSDFMDNMTLAGTMDFKGDFYTGKVNKYIMKLPDSQPVKYFWYLTTVPGDRPVEQGEGGLPSTDDNPSGDGKGVLLWHEYNTTSFQGTTIDPSVFAVPDVCKKTYTSCAFP